MGWDGYEKLIGSTRPWSAVKGEKVYAADNVKNYYKLLCVCVSVYQIMVLWTEVQWKIII